MLKFWWLSPDLQFIWLLCALPCLRSQCSISEAETIIGNCVWCFYFQIKATGNESGIHYTTDLFKSISYVHGIWSDSQFSSEMCSVWCLSDILNSVLEKVKVTQNLLDDLLQLFVLSLQLAGFLFIIVVCGWAGLHGLLLVWLPLTTSDKPPHLHQTHKHTTRGITTDEIHVDGIHQNTYSLLYTTF